MEEEDADFILKGVAVGRCLAGGGFERDGQVTGVCTGDLGWGWEAEDVGWLVFSAERFVESAEGGVVGEEDVYFAGEADGLAGAVEEARQVGL